MSELFPALRRIVGKDEELIAQPQQDIKILRANSKTVENNLRYEIELEHAAWKKRDEDANNLSKRLAKAQAENRQLKEWRDKLLSLTNEQAEDKALWRLWPKGFNEVHLQQELRRLHAEIESD